MPPINNIEKHINTTKQKKMKKLFTTLMIMLSCQLIKGQTKNYIDQPYLETTATIDTIVKPDIIYLDILLREKDNKNRISVEELEHKMAKTLESIGIELKKQLTLSDLASNFKKYFLKQKDVLKSKAYTLKIYDAQTAGKVLMKLESIGISNVSVDKTEYSKMEKLKLELRSKAVMKAKKQANFLIKPLNQKIGSVLFISDNKYNRNSFGYSVSDEVVIRGYSKKQTELEPVDIEFKPIKIITEVSVKFKIE